MLWKNCDSSHYVSGLGLCRNQLRILNSPLNSDIVANILSSKTLLSNRIFSSDERSPPKTLWKSISRCPTSTNRTWKPWGELQLVCLRPNRNRRDAPLQIKDRYDERVESDQISRPRGRETEQIRHRRSADKKRETNEESGVSRCILFRVYLRVCWLRGYCRSIYWHCVSSFALFDM